jgi:hypothetical protein
MTTLTKTKVQLKSFLTFKNEEEIILPEEEKLWDKYFTSDEYIKRSERARNSPRSVIPNLEEYFASLLSKYSK